MMNKGTHLSFQKRGLCIKRNQLGLLLAFGVKQLPHLDRGNDRWLILFFAFGEQRLPHVDKGNDRWIIEIQISSPDPKAPVLVIIPCKVKINKPLKERNMLSTRPDPVVCTASLFLKKSRIRHQTRSHPREDTNDVRKAKTHLEGSPRPFRRTKGEVRPADWLETIQSMDSSLSLLLPSGSSSDLSSVPVQDPLVEELWGESHGGEGENAGA
jgi:hypothetical protein